MNYQQAVITFALNLMRSSTTSHQYDETMISEIASAIANSTDDLSEAETLVKIARYESGGFRKDVASCKVKGDSGRAYGLFQVHPRSKQEAEDLCSEDYVKQVRVALDRVRESAKMCRKFGLTKSDLLSGYTIGRCVKDAQSSKLRYGDGNKIKNLLKKPATRKENDMEKIDTTKYLNLSKRQAQNLAEAQSLIFRLIRVDDEKFFDYPEGDDIRNDRICVEIEDMKVVKAVLQ